LFWFLFSFWFSFWVLVLGSGFWFSFSLGSGSRQALPPLSHSLGTDRAGARQHANRQIPGLDLLATCSWTRAARVCS